MSLGKALRRYGTDMHRHGDELAGYEQAKRSIESRRERDMGRFIDRGELFNRLANVKDLGEAFGVIQGMEAAEVRCGECRWYECGGCSRIGIALFPDEAEWFYCGYGAKRESGTMPPRDRNCDTCWIAQNHNLEDDDTPCQNCEVGE